MFMYGNVLVIELNILVLDIKCNEMHMFILVIQYKVLLFSLKQVSVETEMKL